jgi:glycosyltransferase involved in cell wall biosynthesis
VRDAVSRVLTGQVVRRARRLLVVSEDLRRVAIERYGAAPDRTITIPNGCNAAIFHPASRSEARRQLGVDEGARLVVYVGRLVPEKGLRELLEATAMLSQAHSRVELALIGDGPLRDELDQSARRIAGVPVHLPGAMDASMVARWMAASDLVTLPSYSEGHPNVLVEALASGRPVVATHVGGIPEVVDASCGVLVAPRDVHALSVALGQVMDRGWDPDALARRFSRDWSGVARETLQVCMDAFSEADGRIAVPATFT